MKAERRSPPGLTALTEYVDGMIEHDAMVRTHLKKLDDLGIANNTIVLYTTDNGPHMNSWPDGAMTPFRSEKNTNWEGAFRVPAMMRWPGKIKAGTVSNEIISGLDWLPTLLAAAGEPDIAAKLLKGHAGLGGAVHAAVRAETLRLARRSLRARGHHLEHLLRLVRLAAVPDLPRPR